MGYDFTPGLQISVSSIHRQKHLGICLPTVGSQTWVRSGWEFFRPSGESNPRPWLWIKSARDQRCHRAYSIRGSTPFHSCVEVRSPKLVSSEDRTGARAPSASYCSTEGVAPLHTAPPVPVTAPPVPVTLPIMESVLWMIPLWRILLLFWLLCTRFI